MYSTKPPKVDGAHVCDSFHAKVFSCVEQNFQARKKESQTTAGIFKNRRCGEFKISSDLLGFVCVCLASFVRSGAINVSCHQFFSSLF